jgi:hypothetical protein
MNRAYVEQSEQLGQIDGFLQAIADPNTREQALAAFLNAYRNEQGQPEPPQYQRPNFPVSAPGLQQSQDPYALFQQAAEFGFPGDNLGMAQNLWAQVPEQFIREQAMNLIREF